MTKKEIRRRNAKLYPIYKMFAWDLLFFYSIEFLFCTITKKVTVSELLVINGFYLIFRVLMQIPATIITEHIGKKRAMVLGNVLLIFYILSLMHIPGAKGILIADFIWAWGYNLKLFSESNLLYDSVATKGGDGLFSKIDSKGGMGYYILDGVASVTSGYLFVMNNYIPLYICLGAILISTILSLGFKEVNKVKPKKINYSKTIEEYKETFKFVFNSKRMKSLLLFQFVFYSVIKIIDTYRSDLLIKIGVPEEQYSIILAVLSLIGAMSLTFRDAIEKKFKNKTLAFISLTYMLACVGMGAISSLFSGKIIIPIVIVMCVILRMSTAIWWVLEAKYLKNFTNEKTRGKITFAYEFIGGIGASIFSVFAGKLVEKIPIQNSILIVGLVGLAAMVLTLDYMRKRFGLKPSEYKKSDIKFELKT